MSRERVASLDALKPGSAMKVVIDGIPIALVRETQGEIHALGDRCSHGDISLSEGFVEDDSIECWAHGSKFELSTGTPRNFPAYEPVPVFAVEIDGDDVFVNTEIRK
jgi:3-phenylpropionate/trans-cinnamate dioxygenase ferredoxin subunit